MLQCKRGDSIEIIARRLDSEGNPQTGEATYLRSELRTKKGDLLGEFTISETTTPGDYLLEMEPILTATFPLTVLELDIKYKKDEIVKSSETVQISIVKEITQEVI